MPDPQSTEAAAAAAGLALPAATDLISAGDDAIRLNARFTTDALTKAATAEQAVAGKAEAADALRPAVDPDVIFGVTDEDGRRTWIEAAADGGPTDYSAEKLSSSVAPAAAAAVGIDDQDTDLTGLSFAVVDEDGRRTWIEAAADGGPTDRVRALFGGLDLEQLASGPDIAVWGSSSAAGAGGGGTSITTELTRLTGRTVHTLGVGGNESPAIAARQGGRPWLATISGGQIPASGPVTIVLEADDGITQTPPASSAGMNPVELAGVLGTISVTDGIYSFTRSTAGDAVPTPHRVPVITAAARDRREDICILWVGLNDDDTAEADAEVVGRINAMIDHLTPLDKRYLVAGRWAYDPNPRNEELLLRTYGRRYVNVRDLLVRYGLADNGLTPTAQDELDLAAGRVPTSLKYDAAHMNAYGYTSTAAEFHRRLTEMGWI